MISHKHIELAVAGTIAKAADIARRHGQLALGFDAKVVAEYIATDIEAITDTLKGWEEAEAARAHDPVLERELREQRADAAATSARERQAQGGARIPHPLDRQNHDPDA